jgi:putative endonuclease
MAYIVYVLYSEERDRYYVGQTENLERRVQEHRKRKNLGAIDWKAVYFETYAVRSDAVRRETEIKSKKRKSYIQALVASGI